MFAKFQEYSHMTVMLDMFKLVRRGAVLTQGQCKKLFYAHDMLITHGYTDYATIMMQRIEKSASQIIKDL